MVLFYNTTTYLSGNIRILWVIKRIRSGDVLKIHTCKVHDEELIWLCMLWENFNLQKKTQHFLYTIVILHRFHQHCLKHSQFYLNLRYSLVWNIKIIEIIQFHTLKSETKTNNLMNNLVQTDQFDCKVQYSFCKTTKKLSCITWFTS